MHVNLTVKAVEISPAKEFTVFGRTGRMATARIEDSTGRIIPALWDSRIDILREGDVIRILNGYVKEWKNEA